MQTSPFDVIIIGGSYAGIAAATQLARARRRILIIDAGQRRNRWATHSHGFLTQDGTKAAEIARIAREQLLKYPTVTWLDAAATDVQKTDIGFTVTADQPHHARLLILATGLTDHLPELPGLTERWGQHVFHCPYCHGYELDQGPIGVLATSPMSMHQALMLPDWGPTTFFINGVFEPDTDQLAQLQARGTTVEDGLIDHIRDQMTLVMKDGRTFTLAGLFAAPQIRLASPFAEHLGCDIQQGPIGPMIQTNPMKETTVPGVFACGDTAHQPHNVAFAVADGVMAGSAAHRTLMFG